MAERANELAERAIQPTQQSNTLVEKFATLFGRLNEHFDQSNRIADQSMKRVKKLEDVLGNINRVLVGIQHAIVRVSCPQCILDGRFIYENIEPQGQHSQGGGLFGQRKRRHAWTK
ncbi:hypothetical protein B0J17DRAFT_56585 [Rhizoctonia solani]|nr:hypothetical protein B0J17DRAFT_56585 [Rhizoctonia solani]